MLCVDIRQKPEGLRRRTWEGGDPPNRERRCTEPGRIDHDRGTNRNQGWCPHTGQHALQSEIVRHCARRCHTEVDLAIGCPEAVEVLWADVRKKSQGLRRGARKTPDTP